jgi:hypothetical protein
MPQLYLDIDSVEVGKIRVSVKALIAPDTYFTARKHLFMRIDLTPFNFDIQKGYLTVYAKGVGDITIDQTGTQNDCYIIHKVNGILAGDNADVYTKLEAL